MITLFLGSCGREESVSYSFTRTDSTKIDESKVVLTRFPSGLKEINDSIAGMVTNQHQIGLYNLNSGQNILNFNTKNINFDSLIKETYQKRYSGKRIYTYDSLTAGGLSGGNSQVLGFFPTEDMFYIYVNTLTDVNYSADADQMKKLENDPQIKELIAANGNFEMIVQDYLEFIFVTDQQFHIIKVLPMYLQENLTSKNYSWFFQKNFVIENNTLYVPLINDSFITGTAKTEENKSPEKYSVAKLKLNNSEAAEPKLNYSQIDFSGFSTNDFISSCCVFRKSAEELLFCNGKEVVSVEKGGKRFQRKSLAENEWIQDFNIGKDKRLVFITYCKYKKKQPNEIEIQYNIDSIADINIKVYDINTGLWLSKKQLTGKENILYQPEKEHILCIEKGKENYYFKRIYYYEK